VPGPLRPGLVHRLGALALGVLQVGQRPGEAAVWRRDKPGLERGGLGTSDASQDALEPGALVRLFGHRHRQRRTVRLRGTDPVIATEI
jgi:hypothetical protein